MRNKLAITKEIIEKKRFNNNVLPKDMILDKIEINDKKLK